MEGLLRRRAGDLLGILNGVDYSRWNPAGDQHLSAAYSPDDLRGKTKNKMEVIKEFNLDPALATRPLLGLVSRLDPQKGLDLLTWSMDRIMDLDVGLAILGSGDEHIQWVIREAALRYPGRIGLKTGFNDPLAHRLIAGADLLLVPSLYEPCGLTQMYALKYGTVPVVRATGGLEDTIRPFDPDSGQGHGFKFGPYDAGAFFHALSQAIYLYRHNQTAWRRLQVNAKSEDFSWDRSAGRYLELFRSLR